MIHKRRKIRRDSRELQEERSKTIKKDKTKKNLGRAACGHNGIGCAGFASVPRILCGFFIKPSPDAIVEKKRQKAGK